jgi:hypothetical protein
MTDIARGVACVNPIYLTASISARLNMYKSLGKCERFGLKYFACLDYFRLLWPQIHTTRIMTTTLARIGLK